MEYDSALLSQWCITLRYDVSVVSRFSATSVMYHASLPGQRVVLLLGNYSRSRSVPPAAKSGGKAGGKGHGNSNSKVQYATEKGRRIAPVIPPLPRSGLYKLGAVDPGLDCRPPVTKPKPSFEPPGEKVLDFFAKRCISRETVERNGVQQESFYSSAHKRDMVAVAFPYRREGEVVNIKYRGPNKKFWQVKGAEKVLYGLDDV
eukprot:gene18088-21546_t